MPEAFRSVQTYVIYVFSKCSKFLISTTQAKNISNWGKKHSLLNVNLSIKHVLKKDM